MRVLVTGANGQLGTDLCIALRNFELIPLTHDDIEITNIDSVQEVCFRHKPDVIVNPAPYIKADECEISPDKAFAGHAVGARNIAVIAEQLGAKLVHVSSDYVFGGEARPNPLPYTEFDSPVPLNVYGRSKLAGESFVRHLCRRHFIVRSSGFFGLANCRSKGANFVETIVRLAREQDTLRVVNDQIFSPTYTSDLARKLAQIVDTQHYGTFHITNRGSCSWFGFAKEILRLAGLGTPVIPITSDQYPQKAKRPSFSVLDNYHLRLLGMDDMRPWQEALKDYMGEISRLN